MLLSLSFPLIRITCLTKYECRLQAEAGRLGIQICRKVFHDIDEAMAFDPQATAIFNCTGLGAMTLGGVQDMKMFAARVSAVLAHLASTTEDLNSCNCF